MRLLCLQLQVLDQKTKSLSKSVDAAPELHELPERVEALTKVYSSNILISDQVGSGVHIVFICKANTSQLYCFEKNTRYGHTRTFYCLESIFS